MAAIFDAPYLFKVAELAVKGMRSRGKEPTFLSVNPVDWEAMVAYVRRINQMPAHVKPRRELYGVPVHLLEQQERGDVRAIWMEPPIEI